MKILWKNKFLFWNFAALIFVKTIFSYSGLQLANIIGGLAPFPKEEIIFQTNAMRQNSGLGALKDNPGLDAAAAQKLQDMIQNQYFAHTSPAGISPWHWIDANNYKYTYAGENLAIGFLTAKDTVDAWANSPSHRANLLNSNYKEIGIAVAPADIQNSQGFLVVQLFGTPKPVPLASSAAKPKRTVPVKSSPVVTPIRTPAISQIAISSSPTVQSAAEENVEKPTVIKTDGMGQRLNKEAHVFNVGFMLYALTAFLVSLVILAFYGLEKSLVIRTAASFAILILAVAVPVLQITHTALII